MENTKAKNIIITVLGILLVAVICFVVYYVFIVNKNSISNEKQAANISKLQEEIATKEKEIEELKKANNDLTRQIEEIKKEENVNTEIETKEPTINNEIFSLIGKTIGDAKKKYGSNGKVTGQGEGTVFITLNNDIAVGVPCVYEDYTDEEGVTHFKVKDSQKIVTVHANFKDMFNNYTKACTTEEQLKKLFKEVKYYSQSFWGKMYSLKYDKYTVTVILMDDNKITDSTDISIGLTE